MTLPANEFAGYFLGVAIIGYTFRSSHWTKKFTSLHPDSYLNIRVTF